MKPHQDDADDEFLTAFVHYTVMLGTWGRVRAAWFRAVHGPTLRLIATGPYDDSATPTDIRDAWKPPDENHIFHLDPPGKHETERASREIGRLARQAARPRPHTPKGPSPPSPALRDTQRDRQAGPGAAVRAGAPCRPPGQAKSRARPPARHAGCCPGTQPQRARPRPRAEPRPPAAPQPAQAAGRLPRRRPRPEPAPPPAPLLAAPGGPYCDMATFIMRRI